MVAAPALTPVITPVEGFTVAMEGLVDDQTPPAMVEVKVVVPPSQIDCEPLTIPAVKV